MSFRRPTDPVLAASQDRDDLTAARRGAPEGPIEKKPWYQNLGPGLITGAADDDPSGVGTYSQNGAAFGYGLLWLVPVSLPLMIAVQEMCGRLGLVTGHGIASLLKKHYSKWLLHSCVVLLVLANLANVYADLNAMAASAQMLIPLPNFVWLTILASLVAGLPIVISYRHYSRVLRWTCLSLAAYFVVCFLPGVKNDWVQIGKNLVVPGFTRSVDYVMAAVAFLGTTISPYLFFWQASETVEEIVEEGLTDDEGERTREVNTAEIRNLRADNAVGMVVSQAVAFFIVICSAGTLHMMGKTDINTPQDAAKALAPLGASAVWLFAGGMVGTGMLAIPTLAGSAAYAVAESAGWKLGLYRRFQRARGFYGVVAGVTGIAYLLNFFPVVSPIKALLYSAVLNGVVAVPLLVVLLLMCNNRAIVGDRRNGPWSNVLGVAAVLLMGVASGIFLWGLATGKA